MRKVLLVTDVDFWYDGAGHRVRISSLIAYLCKYVDLHICYIGFSSTDFIDYLKIRFNIKIYLLDSKRASSVEDRGAMFKKVFDNEKFDFLIIEYVHNSYLLDYMSNDTCKTILDTHDIVSERSAEFSEYGYRDAILTIDSNLEFGLFKLYDYVLTICIDDYNTVRSVIDEKKVILCPHPVIINEGILRKEVVNIGFIASEYLPNVDGIRHFLQNSWKRVQKKGNVNLLVYGNVCKLLSEFDSNNVKLMGFEQDRSNIYDNLDIVINPVRFGAGLKIKNLEALSYGKPLVTTKHSARGLYNDDDVFLAAKDDDQFVDFLFALMDDYSLRKRMALTSKKFLIENFSVEKCYGTLINILLK